MLAAKNSRNRRAAFSPAATISASTGCAAHKRAVIRVALAMAGSWSVIAA
jgi:hypothetical protein